MTSSVLSDIECCYDAIPRVAADVEQIGPLTLFLARPGTGWSLYARPRLGATGFAADDVRRVLERQRALAVPTALEWTDEVSPTLAEAAREAAPEAHTEVVPLLAADTADVAPPALGRCRVLGADDPDLPRCLGVVSAGFGGRDEIEPGSTGHRPRLIGAGHLVVVAAYDDQGLLVGGGSAAPRGTTAELMGIATLPSARGRGVGGDVTRALVAAVRAAGVTTAYLTAASDAAAGVYRRAGFARVGTGMILDAG